MGELVQYVKDVGLAAVLALGVLGLAAYLVKQVLKDHRIERDAWLGERKMWDTILIERHSQILRALEHQREEHDQINERVSEARKEHAQMIEALRRLNGVHD